MGIYGVKGYEQDFSFQPPIISHQLVDQSLISLSDIEVALYHMITNPNHCKEEGFYEIMEKEENAGSQHFVLFLQLFSTELKTNFIY